MTKPELGHFRAQGVPLMRKLKEFPVTEDALLPVGTSINVRHFVPGQCVDVTGITKGKGFQVRFSISSCYTMPSFVIFFLCFCKNQVVMVRVLSSKTTAGRIH